MIEKKKYKSLIFFSAIMLVLIGIHSATAASNPFTVEKIEQLNKNEQDIVEIQDDKIKNTAIFHNINERATYKITIKNNDNKNYIIKEVKNNNNNKYISYSYNNITNKIIPKGSSKDLIITATYENEIDDTNNREQKLNSLFTIIYEDSNNFAYLIANNIHYLRTIMIITIVVAAGIISLVVMYCIQNNKKLTKVALTVFLLSSVFVPFIAKASSLPYSITLSSKYLLNNKLLVKINDKEEVVDYSSTIDSISIPNKRGYNFTGWLSENNEVINPETKITSDLVIKPAYTLEKYSINYVLNKGKLNNSIDSYTIEDNVILPTPIKDGYKFIGWTEAQNDELITVIPEGTIGNKVLYAQYELALYQITYEGLTEEELNNLTNPQEYNLEQELLLSNLNNRVDEDDDETEIFKGWEENNNIITSIEKGSKGNKVITALWEKAEPKKYTITYDLKEGEETTNPTSFTKFDEVKLNAPHKTGYQFIGWTVEETDTPTIDMVISKGTRKNQKFIANYSPITYQISYNLDGGIVSSNKTSYTIEDDIKLNKPEKEGYTFYMWEEKDGSLIENIAKGSYNNKELIALYNANEYQINFDKNDIDAYGYMASQVAVYDETTILNENKYQKEDYKFIGWNIEDSKEVYKDQEQILNLKTKGEVTLYAKWEKILIGSFINGKELNATMKRLAGNTTANYDTKDNSIVTIKRSKKLKEDAIIVSTPESDKPIYMWFDNGIIYYYTELEQILLNENSSYLFNNLRGLKNIDISDLNTKKVTNMESMFSNCTSLVNLDLSSFNTKNVKNMKNMFKESSKIETLNISSFNTSNVTTMNSMFWNLSNLKEINVTNFDTSNVEDMYAMFYSLKSIKSLNVSSFNTSKVKDMSSMFGNLLQVKELDLSNFKTNKVKKMENMFNGSSNLITINLSNFDTSNVTSMLRMFSSTKSIKKLDISSFDTRNVTNMSKMFDNMDSLQTIYVSDKFTIDKVSNGTRMFANDINIIGEDGTIYNPDKIGLEYARVGEKEIRGYFTRKKEETE